jgi:chaperonin GroES
VKLRPLRDQVLVKRAEAKSETDGGLIIPENAKIKSRHGEVVAVGPGRFLNKGGLHTVVPLEVKVGDVIHFRGTAGHEVEIDDEKFVLLHEDEIDGLVEEP